MKSEAAGEVGYRIEENKDLRGHTNPSAILSTDGNILLLSRHITHSSLTRPDKGSIVAMSINGNNNGQQVPYTLEELKLDQNTVISRREVWNSCHRKVCLEDFRSRIIRDNRVLSGLTLVKIIRGNDVPFPAIYYFPNAYEIPEINKPPRVVDEFGPGKNMTPVDEETFVFRKDGEAYNHALTVVKWDEKKNKVYGHGELKFPADLPWASYRIGTGMPPSWVFEKEALFNFHGIVKPSEKAPYTYSIGIAKLIEQNGKLELGDICPEPILVYKNVVERDKIKIEELHPDLREVLYTCGGILGQTDLLLFVNLGDTRTVGVRYNKSDLMELFPWKGLAKVA